MKTTPENLPRRLFVPGLMTLLTAVFLVLAIYQVRSQTRSGSIPAEVARPPADAEPVSLGNSAGVTPAPEPGSAGESSESEDLVAIREHLADALDFLRWDREKYKKQGPKIALQRAELTEYLASLPPHAVHLLLEILATEEDFVLRRFLLYGLGAIGSDDAALGLFDYYQKLSALDEDKISEIDHTIKALGTVDSDLSFALLEHQVDSGAKAEHRHRFVRELGNHSQRQQAVPLFLDLAENDRNLTVRNRSAQALKKTRDPSTARDLERLLQSEPDYVVKQTLMGALGAIGDAGSFNALERVATSDENYVNRLSAVNAIFTIGGPDAKDILRRIAEQDTHERVRADARRAVVKLEEQGY